MSDVLFQRGESLFKAGKVPEAIAAYRAAIAADPKLAQRHNNLANALMAAGQTEAAIESFRNALKLLPGSAAVEFNLGSVLANAGRVEEALVHLRRALELKPGDPDIENNFANALLAAGYAAEAAMMLRHTVSVRPRDPRYVMNLANTLRALGELDEPIQLFQRALELRPGWGEAFNNLGVCWVERGEMARGIAALRKATELPPDFAAAESNLVFYLQFLLEYDAARLLEEHRKWDRRHAQPLAGQIAPFGNNRNPQRRLRVGYVSPDFRRHCQAFFTLPLFSNHDHGNFEIFCYSSVMPADENTARIKGLADVWRECHGKSDAQVAEMIRADAIDILVDLTMHMANGRPLLFARKPAPIQVAWLAYPGTTGMGTMDYRITDPYLDPPGVGNEFYSETSYRLGDTFWCYDPLGGDPGVQAPPASRNGFITFGCLNAARKINDRTLGLWRLVLEAVPGSRIIVMFPEGMGREELVGKLGVARQRVEFVASQPRAKYMETYGRIDIGLDTLPYNGHTTTLDSFWMGVPVITRVGDTVAGRAGWSQLSNLKLAELAGHSDEEFVRHRRGAGG